MFPLIKELKENKNFACITINTGQHKEMMQRILESFNIDNTIDFNLNLMKQNQSLSKLTSKVISELEKIYSLISPNAIIVQGDTTTGLAAAISAFYQKIPIFHVEAGLRTHMIFELIYIFLFLKNLIGLLLMISALCISQLQTGLLAIF